nr:aldose 1-epimerase [Roseateles toxinivorans]
MPGKSDLATLENGQLRASVQPGLGAGLTRLDWWHRGAWEPLLRPLSGPASDPEQLACCLLMPWSNRLYGSSFTWRGRVFHVRPSRAGDRQPLHGDAWVSAWSVISQGSDEIVLEFDARQHRPLAYIGRVHYRLDASRLQVSLCIEHCGDEPMPYGMGLHPWFVRESDTQIQFNSKSRWEPQAEQPPSFEMPLHCGDRNHFGEPQRLPSGLIDHAYAGWDGHARIRWPSRGLALEMRATDSSNHLVVYSPPQQATHGFVCLEPVTHRNGAHIAADPLVQGLVELRRGQHLELEVSLVVTSDLI